MSNDEIMAIVPIFILGAFCGAASYYSTFFKECRGRKCSPSIGRAIGSAMAASATSFIIFAALDASGYTFMTKIAISCGVAFLGIDKALDTIERVFKLWREHK